MQLQKNIRFSIYHKQQKSRKERDKKETFESEDFGQFLFMSSSPIKNTYNEPIQRTNHKKENSFHTQFAVKQTLKPLLPIQ